MEKTELSSSEAITLEQNMIRTIVQGYNECKSFFSLNRDYADPYQNNAKKDLLKRLSHTFYQNFSSHPHILSDDYAQEVLHKYFRVFIRVKGGSFPYPYGFVRFMDRLQDRNTIPIREIDLTPLDNFMEMFSDHQNLEEFLLLFFQVVKTLLLPLRERDVELIKLLTNPQLLLKDKSYKSRVHTPDMKDLLQLLGLNSTQINRVKRSYQYLYKYRICNASSMIMNPATFGFYIAEFEYTTEQEKDLESLRPYFLWDIPFKNRKSAIACVPYGNTNELLRSVNYIQMTNYYWNINFDSLTHDKYDTIHGWSKFNPPNFLAKDYRISDYVEWDLERSFKDEFSTQEIEILKNLSKGNVLNYQSLGKLSGTLSSGGVRYILEQFVDNGVYQLYPQVNHLGLKEIIFVKITCKDEAYYKSLIHSLLSFPIAHVLTNDQEKLIVGYFHINSKFVEEITDNFNLLAGKLGEAITIEYELLPKKKILLRLPQLDKINFSIRNGVAYTIE
ncbi:MAG: hypothetical protein HeimC3_16660 [Candidatus Heimdallarchaeota archaeon LC_3]|nr:MAG: hypothetical protein HeimC3_16660 [Candidatus Heimdallarchaeota archaeon LC_3]